MAKQDSVVLEAPEPKPEKQGAADQFHRNMEIVADKARGDTWPKIAERHGVTVRRCQQVVAEYRKTNPTLRHADPVEIVDEMLEGMRIDMADLNDLVRSQKNDAARLGAINARRQVRRDIIDLLQQTGTLPNDLGTMTVAIEAQVVVSRIVDILTRFEVPPEVEDAILDEVLGGEEPKQLVA